mmetsp:Transcript_9668/g.32767  ORF Transcript_9668/g.32767 Transcript_9668/m.32767 type:complete len:322 (-) Transcript_9668:1038-2003(-)
MCLVPRMTMVRRLLSAGTPWTQTRCWRRRRRSTWPWQGPAPRPGGAGALGRLPWEPRRARATTRAAYRSSSRSPLCPTPSTPLSAPCGTPPPPLTSSGRRRRRRGTRGPRARRPRFSASVGASSAPAAGRPTRGNGRRQPRVSKLLPAGTTLACAGRRRAGRACASRRVRGASLVAHGRRWRASGSGGWLALQCACRQSSGAARPGPPCPCASHHLSPRSHRLLSSGASLSPRAATSAACATLRSRCACSGRRQPRRRTVRAARARCSSHRRDSGPARACGSRCLAPGALAPPAWRRCTWRCSPRARVRPLRLTGLLWLTK